MDYLWMSLLVSLVRTTAAGFGVSQSATIQQSDLTVRLDSTINITCIVLNRQPIVNDVTWSFNHYDGNRDDYINKSSKYHMDVTQNNRFSVTSALTVASVTYDDEGRYTCHYGNMFDSIGVTVKGRPVVTKATATVNGILENDVTLTCEAQARGYDLISDPTHVVWSDQSGAELDTNPFKYSIDNTDNNLHPVFQSRLTIYEMTKADVGLFACNVSNKFGSAQTLVRLTAKPSLTIIEPRDYRTTATLFDTVTFLCRVFNIESTEYVGWYLGDDSVSEQFGVRQTRNYQEDRGVRIHELFFLKIVLQDEGVYSCRGKNLTEKRYLNVVGSLEITQKYSYFPFQPVLHNWFIKPRGSLGIQAAQKEIVTAPGFQIRLECSVQSRPISQIEWYHSNTKITSNSKYEIKTSNDSDISVHSFLTIRKVQLEDFKSLFICVSHNSLSETSRERITVRDVNECEAGTHTCDLSREVCVDTLGAFRCDCRSEYTLIDQTCQAVTSSIENTTTTPSSTSVNSLPIGLGIGLGLCGIFAMALVMICCLCRRLKSQSRKLINVPRSSECYDTTFDVTSQEVHLYSELTRDSWEFPRNRVRFLNVLGEGKFGKVLKAEAMDIRGNKTWDEVAVKIVKETATDADKEDFYHELLIVRKIPHHVNVVTFLGCCTVGEPALMIMEYVSGTDLLTYIRTCRPGVETHDAHTDEITQKDLLSFAFQTARGLRHLENNKIVHRDVAARNVLISKGRSKVCKISDFGLARDIEGADVYERTSKGPLPIRWMAPESLRDTIHTHKSDIWAYGILLWEIITLGSSPYPGMSSKQVMTYVLAGKTQESPPQCNKQLSKVMQGCWEFDAADRPSFADVVDMLEGMLEVEGDYIQLHNMQDGIYHILDAQCTEETI